MFILDTYSCHYFFLILFMRYWAFALVRLYIICLIVIQFSDIFSRQSSSPVRFDHIQGSTNVQVSLNQDQFLVLFDWLCLLYAFVISHISSL